MDITELLERAVADVTPAERRPTDAVLRLAESRRLGSRLRKALAGLAGLVVIGGGVAVVATGGQDDDGDRQTVPPRPLTLQVELPDGWRADTSSVVLKCTSTLAARTVYRNALIRDIGRCGEPGPTVPGPAILIGRLDPQLAEKVRATGVVVAAAGTAGYVVGFDTVSSFGVFLPVGEHDDTAYAVLAPHSQDDEPAYGDPYNVVPVPSLPTELIDVMSTVRATGDIDSELVLPDDVSDVRLQNEFLNVGAAPGAEVGSAGAVADVLAELASGRAAGEVCGAPVSGRTFWLHGSRPVRWTRLDVLVDDEGCRTAASELGGTRVISGDPVAVATDRGEARVTTIGNAASTVQEHGLSVAVPEGWEVVRSVTVDPCTLAGPSVVVADVLAPSCYAAQYTRPTYPFVWVTSNRLEAIRLFTDDRTVVPVDPSPAASVRWTEVTLELPGSTMTGLLGVPETGTGRLFVSGLDQRASLGLRQTVEPG